MSILTPLQQAQMDDLLRTPENRLCFDCGAPQPRWASTTLGVFLCMRCAGIHRSLGVHISSIRSVSMDSWDKALLKVMDAIGNKGGKVLYEYQMPPSAQPTQHTPAKTATQMLKTKYERKAYYNPSFDRLRDEMMQTFTETSQQNRSKRQSLVVEEPLVELWGEPVVAAAAPIGAPTKHDPHADLFQPLPPQQQQPHSDVHNEVLSLFAMPSQPAPSRPPGAW